MNPLTFNSLASKNPRASFFTTVSSVCLIASILAACQANPPVTEDIDKAMREPSAPANTSAANGAPLAPPPAVNAALLPSDNKGAAARDSRADISRFDISVKDADATDFFMGLVEGTPYNMLVQPGVGGKITMSLKNVSVPEVMEAVRNVYGYDYSYRNGIFEVMPGGMATRFFPIDYLNLKRIGMSRARVNSGQLADNGNNNGNNSGSNTNGTNSSNVVQIPSTEISTDTEADLWTELQTTVRALVGEGEGKQVVVSPQTGMVVVRASSRELSAVEDFLKRAQLSLERQVILEAKIIEVTLDDGFQSGINWSKLGTINGSPFNIGVSGASLGGATPTLPFGAITPSELNPLGGVFTGTYTSTNFDGAIELLKTQGSVQVLSSPRVSTVNNQKAVIKVGSDEFFVTAISSNTTTTTTGNTNTIPNVTLTPFFSGIALDVTPQISEQGQITLHVHPSVTQVTDQQKQLTVFDQQFELPLAYSTSRETDTIVRAKNGQVVVIGGLMQNKDDDREAGAPGLADVPLLGYLFKQKRKSTTKSELVILLRPIVPDDAQWEEQVNNARTRMDNMHPPLKQKILP